MWIILVWWLSHVMQNRSEDWLLSRILQIAIIPIFPMRILIIPIFSNNSDFSDNSDELCDIYRNAHRRNWNYDRKNQNYRTNRNYQNFHQKNWNNRNLQDSGYVWRSLPLQGTKIWPFCKADLRKSGQKCLKTHDLPCIGRISPLPYDDEELALAGHGSIMKATKANLVTFFPVNYMDMRSTCKHVIVTRSQNITVPPMTLWLSITQS